MQSNKRRKLRETFGRGLAASAVTGAIVLAPLAAMPAAHAAEATPVLDSTFENGQGAWFANGSATVSVVADPANAGGHALLASNITHDYDGQGIDLLPLLQPGVAYTISYDVRLADADQPAGSAHFTVNDKVGTAADGYHWIGDNTPLSADSWKTITGTYTLPEGATKANLYLNAGGSAPFPNVLLDNVKITPSAPAGGTTTCDPRPNRTLINASFDGSLPGTLSADGPVTLSYEQVDGNSALKIAGRSADWQGIQTSSGSALGLKAGDAVTVNAKARLADASQAATAMRIIANYTKPDGTQAYDWIGNASVSAGAWTTIGSTYTIPAGIDVSTLKFYIGAANNTAGTAYDFYVDDFTLTAPPSDTVISSDFEDGATDGWTGRNGATLAVTDGGKDSDKALSDTGRTNQGQGPLYDVTCLLTAGTTYQFDGDIRFAAGQPTDKIDLSIANTVSGSTAYTNALEFDTVTNTGWTHVTGKFTVPAGDSTQIYLESKYHSGTDGNTSDLLFDNLQVTIPTTLGVQTDLKPIKDTLPFPVGAAITSAQTVGDKATLLAQHFNQLTPENFMKPEAWYDKTTHQFVTSNTEADAVMTYAQQNNMRVYGHNLVWYQQTPDWFFQDDAGNFLTNSPADQAIMRQRLKDHIDNVAKYLSDKYGKFGSDTNPLVSFDVVNEAVSDNVGDPDDLRQSHWYQILGKSYIEDAFNDAEEAFNKTYADPSATRPIKLFYNDYNTEQAGKRGRVLDLIKRLISEGVPVDGIGHQFHVTLSTPVSTLKAAIEGFQGITTASGKELQQAITELDVPTGTPVTQANEIDQGYYYKSVFDMLRDEYKADPDIYSATVWGLTDSQSWRASSGAPLLFDDDLQAKPAYYGVTDQALPAKQLSATVFQQDTADVDAASTGSADSVTGNVEWSQLPLQQVGDDAGFQLRWSADHLTAYVSSTDATKDATDAASFAWGDGTSKATVNRDGTVTGLDGVKAKVTSTDAGWAAVVNLPTDALTATSTPKFDVTVTDGSNVTDWNTPGNLGTLKLVEPLSFTTIPEASTAPVVDGTKDAVWDEATSVSPSKLIQGTATDTTAKIYQLWKGQYLYVRAEVKDATGADQGGDSSPNAYERDSLEIFTDPGNAKNGGYRADDAQMRLGANGTISFGAGDSEAAQGARLQSFAKRVDGGYVVEARIDLKDGNTGVGKFDGLDYEINDGANGARVANYGWAEQTGAAYQTTSRWGVGELVAGATTPNPGTGTGTPNPGTGSVTPVPHPQPPVVLTPVQKAQAKVKAAQAAVKQLKKELKHAKGAKKAKLKRQLKKAEAKVAKAKKALAKLKKKQRHHQ